MARIANARDLKVDKTTGGLVLENGDLVLLAASLESIEQSIRLRLGLVRGEWFLDQERGVPYFEDILVKNPNFVVIREHFRRALKDAPGVLEVLSLSLRYDGALRQLTVTFRVSTDFGELTGEQVAAL